MGTIPKGYGGKVLYLDFDGVLHHENCLWHPKRGVYLQAPPEFTLFQHAPLLDELLMPYADVLIVLSTSWVRTYGVARTVKFLPEGLLRRVIGATFHSRMSKSSFMEMPRGQQVYEDFLRRRPSRVVAIDDLNEGWEEPFSRHLVLTHPTHGIAHPPVLDELKRMLALEFGPAQSSVSAASRLAPSFP
jgi:hypothetical protein